MNEDVLKAARALGVPEQGARRALSVERGELGDLDGLAFVDALPVRGDHFVPCGVGSAVVAEVLSLSGVREAVPEGAADVLDGGLVVVLRLSLPRSGKLHDERRIVGVVGSDCQ